MYPKCNNCTKIKCTYISWYHMKEITILDLSGDNRSSDVI